MKAEKNHTWDTPSPRRCVRLWDIPPDLGLTGPVFVGDTVATGTTLVGVLGWLVQKMEAAGSVQDIFVFTIVVSTNPKEPFSYYLKWQGEA